MTQRTKHTHLQAHKPTHKANLQKSVLSCDAWQAAYNATREGLPTTWVLPKAGLDVVSINSSSLFIFSSGVTECYWAFVLIFNFVSLIGFGSGWTFPEYPAFGNTLSVVCHFLTKNSTL